MPGAGPLETKARFYVRYQRRFIGSKEEQKWRQERFPGKSLG